MNTATQSQFTAPAFTAALDAGDSAAAVTLTGGAHPVRVIATLERDFDGDIPSPEVWNAAQIAEWEAGEWTFWGMVLSVWVGDHCIDKHAASIWGIDCVDEGYRNDDHLAELANGLLAEADVPAMLRDFAAKVTTAAEAAGGTA